MPEDPTGPNPLRQHAEIPEALRKMKRWIPWDLRRNAGGRMTKQPRGSTRDVAALRTFDEVLAEVGSLRADGGAGIVLTGSVPHGGGYVIALDLDSCVDPSTRRISAWAQAILDAAQSYAEISPSGFGLRIFVIADGPLPRGRSKVRIDAPGTNPDKQPEIQVFGLGAAGYVTVTSNAIGPHRELRRIGKLTDLPFLADLDGQVGAEPAAALPAPTADEPSLQSIHDAVIRAPHGEAFVSGRWQELVADSAPDEDRSASAAYYRGAQIVLRAAHGHATAAARYLLQCTAWGLGHIDGSAEPERYRREPWVIAEVGRVAGKAPVPDGSAFRDGFDPTTWVPPVTTVDPLGEFGPRVPDGASKRWLHVTDFLGVAGEVESLVHGVFPRTGLAELFGAPGCGKTPVALNLALAVASGQATWFGHDVDAHGPVLYMLGEDPAGFTGRLRAEAAQTGLDLDKLPLYVSSLAGRLTDHADVRRWVAEAIDLAGGRPVRLVVVDTVARNFGPGHESDTRDMSAFVAGADAIVRALRCLVVLVHHPSKGDAERSRGSSVLEGAIDASYQVVRPGRGLGVRVTVRKLKNFGDPDPMLGTLRVVELGTDAKGRKVTAVALDDRPSTAEALGIEQLAQLGITDGILRAIAEADGQPLTEGDLAEAALTKPGRPFRKALAHAVELGLVTVEGKQRGTRGATYRLTAVGIATHNACSAERLRHDEQRGPALGGAFDADVRTLLGDVADSTRRATVGATDDEIGALLGF